MNELELEALLADYDRRYNLANIPKRLRGATLKAVPDRMEYKEKIVKYGNMLTSAEGTTTGLYMYGSYGSGKTSLAVGLAMHAIRHGVYTYFVRYTDLFGLYRENPQWHPDTDAGVWDWMRKVKLLVVDDLFRHHTEKYGKLNGQMLEQLLEYRLDHGLLHIFTSNVDLEEAEDSESRRLAELIVQSCYVQEISGMNYRQVIAERRKTL